MSTPVQPASPQIPTKDTKQVIRDRMRKKRQMNRALMWGIPLILVVVAIAWFVVNNEASVGGGTEAEAMPVATDHIRGSIDVPVKLVEYGDFQCPACAAYHPALKALEAEYPNDLVVVYRHFPLVTIHPLATPAAVVAEAASVQGKFWEMHDKLYENQTEWATARNPEELFLKYATDLGLDLTKFSSDITTNAETFQSIIEGGMRSGFALKLLSTPSFFLNGERVTASSPQGLVDLVSAKVLESRGQAQ